MRKFLLMALVLMMVLGGTAVMAQDDDENTITWELVTTDPLSVHGDAGAWNSTYNEPGAVIYHEDQYHMFLNGYPGFPRANGIGYLVSDDGVDFEWVSEDPVLLSEDAPNDPIAISATDVLILEDGTWVLYFYNFNSPNWPRVQGTIGRATADNPAGPWTFDEDPVLVAGEDDSFDENGVTFASIIPYEDGYVMYYIGENGIAQENLGRATSEDGINWEKDPEPVFEISRDFGENTNFVVNQVIYDGERWILAYKVSHRAVGIATSEDGITWERYSDNPIMAPEDLGDLDENINQIGFITLMQGADDKYVLFIEANIGGPTQVYAAILDIP